MTITEDRGSTAGGPVGGGPSGVTPAAVRRLIDDVVGPSARHTDDDGVYPAGPLVRLGAAGAFGPHVVDAEPSGEAGFATAITIAADLSAACLTTGFCTWCQHSAAWLLAGSDNSALRHRLLPDLTRGAVMAGVGLANPVKAMRGTERFKLQAERVAGGYLVSGAQPWISNMGEGHWFATVFADRSDPSHRVMAMVRCGQPGVTTRPNDLMTSLRGSGTVTVLFKRAFIAVDQILADPCDALMVRAYPGIVLLQMGMAFGVIHACIALMREADAGQSESNGCLPRHPDEFEAERDALRHRVAQLCLTPRDGSTAFLRSVLQARLEASELTLAATQMAMVRTGLPAFMKGSPVDRRLREGNFVATITPSVRFIRRELSLPEGSSPWSR